MSKYIVLVGRKPGLYDTWEECKEQTLKYSGARFRKVETCKEAIDYCIDAYNKLITPDIPLDSEIDNEELPWE